MWRQGAEKFRVFWGAFAPSLARRVRQERVPQQFREEESRVFGPEAPRETGEHFRVLVRPHVRCLVCGLQAAHPNEHQAD